MMGGEMMNEKAGPIFDYLKLSRISKTPFPDTKARSTVWKEPKGMERSFSEHCV